MLELRDILWDVVLPGAIAVLVVALSWRAWDRGSAPRAHWAGPLALGLAFAIVLPALIGSKWRLPGLPPGESAGWLFYIAIVGALIGVIDALVSIPSWARLAIVLIFSAASIGVFLSFLFGPDSNRSQ